MTAESLLAASSSAEHVLWAGAIVLGTVCVAKALLRPAPRPATLERWEASLTGSRERLLLAVILAIALLMRTIGWSWPLTTPFYFSEKTTLSVAKMLSEGTLWQHWIQSFGTYQAGWDYDSPLMLPVVAAAQWLLGPRFHLPVLAGAVWGVSAVALAWALGRAAHSRTFGLIFAALVAASPLELVWSRMGGVHIGCVPHVLLVLLLAFLVGKRGSAVLAVAAAAATWASLYQYYAARVVIPLAAATLWAGLRASRWSVRHAALVLALFALTLVAIYGWARPPSFKEAVWPAFRGYVGNKGERDVAELVSRNVVEVRDNLETSLRRYILVSRANQDAPGRWISWGAQSGGLCLLPVALLGLVGLVRCAWRLHSGWVWLLLVASGLAVPALSLTQARRLLVFDLGWCGLATFGVLTLVTGPLFRGLSSRATA